MLFDATAATLTGRLRAGVGYTEAKNTPFQSLCADGAKLALWRLRYVGFKPYAFVHDEILVSLPSDTTGEPAMRVRRIMESAMEEVMGHGIPAECDAVVAGHWKKP
jgi:DNA polymerase I-like protein with 3'-5' exonuclease and polymerase domains